MTNSRRLIVSGAIVDNVCLLRFTPRVSWNVIPVDRKQTERSQRPLYFFLQRCHKATTNWARIPPAVSMPTSTTDAVRVETKDWWNSSPAAQRASTITAKKDHRHFHNEIELPRNVRNSKRPKTKYSMTCPAFLITTCIRLNSWDEILGIKRPKTISNHENVFSEENVSVDIQKMMAIQNTTGSQYLMKFRLKVIVALTPFGWALSNNLR